MGGCLPLGGGSGLGVLPRARSRHRECRSHKICGSAVLGATGGPPQTGYALAAGQPSRSAKAEVRCTRVAQACCSAALPACTVTRLRARVTAV